MMAFPALIAAFTRGQNLLDGSEQAIGIREHQGKKLLALGLAHIATLHGFEVQADGRNRSLELVSYGVDETIVLLVTADFTDQENRIENHSGDDGQEEDDAEEKFYAFAPTEDDPADLQRDGESNERAP